MARYFVKAVDDSLLPDGKEWCFVDDPNGDVYFLVGCTGRPVEIPPDVLDELEARVREAYRRRHPESGPELQSGGDVG